MQAAYAGDKAKEITNREAEVVNAWMNLQGILTYSFSLNINNIIILLTVPHLFFAGMCEGRKQKLGDTGDLFRFFNMVRTLMLWMDDVIIQMNTSEKPRYI